MDDQLLFKISLSVDTALNPSAVHADRLEAHKVCEAVKDHPLCNVIGFTLASNHNASHQVRHFGLQMMREFVRHKWTKASEEIQLQTKDNAIELVKNCAQNEVCFIKDGIAHILAEIVKHIWPQHWPTMVPDLLKIAHEGPIQIELVELVFLRVAEDVAVLQNVPVGHRSQDIRHAFSICMQELLGFFMNVLQNCSNKCVALDGSNNAAEQGEFNVNFNLCTTTLKTCQGFVEWTNTEHMFINDGAYIHVFCTLLKVEGLKVLSAECLILLIHRKGQPADRERILSLTSERYVQVMVEAIEKSLRMHSGDDHQYLFMKRMGELIACLSAQINAAWVADKESATSGFISDLKKSTAFLNLMMEFLRLDNPVLSECVTTSWHHLLQHRGFSKDETLHSYIPDVFRISASRLQKYDSVKLPTCAQLDFNDEIELKSFLFTHKRNLLQIVRGCAVALPIECMTEVIQWVSQELIACANVSLKTEVCVSSELKSGSCVSLNQEPVEHVSVENNGGKLESDFSCARWDSLRSMVEMTIKTGLVYAAKLGQIELAPFKPGAEVFRRLLSFHTTNVAVSQSVLSMIGGFLPLFEHVKDERDELMELTVKKIISMLKQAVNQPDKKGSMASILRRHCLSSVIHICKYYPSFLFPIYESFKNELTKVLNIVSDLESVAIYEAVVLVSGEQKNFEMQSCLIAEVLNFAKNRLVAPSDTRMKSPEDFAKAVGLLSSGDQYMADETNLFRKNVSFCVAIILAMINRSRIPDNEVDLRNGGFYDSEGNVMNPCGKDVLTLMEYVVTLVENFHGLWSPQVKSIIHSDFRASLDIRDCERKAMITANPVIKELDETDERMPWQRMQTFILVVLENCYQILGGVGKCCSIQLYNSPHLFPVFLKKAFSNFLSLPDLRIRTFTRQFLYQFLKSCPEELSKNIIAPVLIEYCKLMNTDLKKRWDQYEIKEHARLQVFESRNGDVEDFEDSKEDDEILKEQLLRTVSRVYLDLLVNLCINKNPKPKNANEGDGTNNSSDTEMQDDSVAGQLTANVYQLTSLGSLLTQTDAAETILVTALFSLTWHDTTSAFKGVQLLWPLLKLMFSSPLVPEDAAKFIFESTLAGLRKHGQHDGCSAQLIALSSFIYVTLRPKHSSIFTILQSTPGVNRNALLNFDENYTKYAEKKRKTNFRKLVSNTIEQHVSQRYRNRQEMRKLPRFFLRKSKTQNVAEKFPSLESLFEPES